jgi:hypothetical protein
VGRLRAPARIEATVKVGGREEYEDLAKGGGDEAYESSEVRVEAREMAGVESTESIGEGSSGS